MKARIIKTGEPLAFTSEEMGELIANAKQNPIIDWEQRRYEIAKAVIQGIWSDTKNRGNGYDMTQYEWYSSLASKAIMQANALIEELKKK